MNGCLESNSFFLKLSSDSRNFLCQFTNTYLFTRLIFIVWKYHLIASEMFLAMNGWLESNSFFLKLSSYSINFLCQFFKSLPIYQINFHSVKISFYSLWNVSFLQWMDAWNQIHSSWNFLQILEIFYANFSNTYLFTRSSWYLWKLTVCTGHVRHTLVRMNAFLVFGR